MLVAFYAPTAYVLAVHDHALHYHDAHAPALHAPTSHASAANALSVACSCFAHHFSVAPFSMQLALHAHVLRILMICSLKSCVLFSKAPVVQSNFILKRKYDTGARSHVTFGAVTCSRSVQGS